MSRALDIEFLKELFSDKRTHISIAQIKKVSAASDRSFVRCLINLLPDNIEYVAKMTMDLGGGDSGLFQLPSVGDMVLVAFADGDPNLCFIIRKLSSIEDKIPVRSAEGDMTLVSLLGKKLWLTSDTRVNISKGSNEPTENLVLGQELKTLLVSMLTTIQDLSDQLKDLSTKVSTHTHMGNLSFPTQKPLQEMDFVSIASSVDGIKTQFGDMKSSPVQDEKILSDLAFTEKG